MSEKILTLRADSGENVYAYGNENGKTIPLNSLYSPRLEAEKFIDKFFVEKKVYVLIGIGNSTLLKDLIESNGRYVHLYIIEPFNDIKPASDLQTIMLNNKEITFQYFDEVTLPLRFSSIIENYIGIEVEILFHPHYKETNSPKITRIIEMLKESIKLVKLNQNTEILFQKDWIIEPLLNLKFTKELSSIEEVKNIFSGQKAFLVASGPSFKEHIQTLKKFQKNAFIFAAGSAVNALLNNGIPLILLRV
ncbi:6-hydroxymethylpterin diphosphokinase MptE-like protein [Tepidibacillus marianensis]|uniref:6-hydroxymethylpterin diphosphokinase MptE-like protein n=1 Tax=Tepidibacillus marianensis TaxID=3131995 RepID=UPI0030D62866